MEGFYSSRVYMIPLLSPHLSHPHLKDSHILSTASDGEMRDDVGWVLNRLFFWTSGYLM